ncbi:hypothetical protein O6H91_03G016500 [Diphasiastrum complanatum]|uniref:Uncharacterized protein n=3 Tax=Diphasiastrum complanatum TaxID=34168 RepID=A0ACC2E3V7_DIPCM|nr:hypothetical protein O6H91_03G016500 [Diphasiastrum complanatum]KAJ7561155.1 hypothetical protein O6H91_03G016500 [Diphasiastrum complanatum]KAJ7561156.1 hypothetical protein O6H91_03G016500 [Diphasiastrum complanatum]
MGLSSHHSKSSTSSAKYKAENLNRKNPLILGCVGSAERSAAGKPAGSKSGALKKSSSSNSLPLQTALVAKPHEYVSRSGMSRGRGLLKLKGPCVCESVVSVEETKSMTKKAYLAISTKGQTPHASNTQEVPTFKVRDLDQCQRANDWIDVKYKRRTSCSSASSGSSPPLQNLASSWSSSSARAEYIFSRAKPTLSPETNMASQNYSPNTKAPQSFADSYKLVGQPQEAIVLYQKVLVAAMENSTEIAQNMTDKFFIESKSSSSKMRDDGNFASADAKVGGINSVEATEIASHEQGDSWYSPPTERSSPSSASLAGTLNLEDRWEAASLSHAQNLSADSVEISRSLLFHSTADTARRSFHNIGSTLRLSPETAIPFSTGSRRRDAWPITDEDEMLAISASDSDAVKKLDNSFGDCGPSLGVHKFKKELHGNGQVEASRSSKAVRSGENKKSMQDSSGFSVSNRPSSKGAVRSVKCSPLSGTAIGELSPTWSYLDTESIAIGRARQAASHYCLPAHRPPLHTLLTNSDSFEPVGSSASVKGLLECILTEETLSFRFRVARSKETLIAESCRGANIFKKGVGDPLFTIFSRTGNGKEKTGWKRWRKKQRHSMRIIAEMQVTTGGQCTVDSHGKPLLHSELEFVLLGEGLHQPSSYILDEKKSNRNLTGLDHISGEYSQISPQSISHLNTPELSVFSREENISNDSSSVIDGPDGQIENKSCKSSSSQLGISKHVGGLSHQFGLEKWHESCEKVAYNEKVRVGLAAQLKTELSAIVIQLPTSSQINAVGLGDDADTRSKLGWDVKKPDSISSGIKSLSQSHAFCLETLLGAKSHQENICESLSNEGVDIHSNSAELEFEKDREENLLSSTEDSLEVKDVRRFMNANDEHVTIILPAGEHGCPTTGLEGPQPLIRRWKSGGKCDCGNWDLGCGLVILKNEQSCGSTEEIPKTDTVIKHNQDQYSHVEMFIQDRKQKEVAMNLFRLHDGLFSMSFQEPMSSLQAFAAAVAILYCRLQPTILSKDKEKLKYAKMKPPRVPFRTIRTSNSESERASPWRNKAYTRGCQLNPPLNAVDRA